MAYRFNDAAQVAYAHVWGKFCDWYVEFSKPLLDLLGSKACRETQQTMAWALDQCLIILHPIMPFITEELWDSICYRREMLITHNWPEYIANDLQNVIADNEIEWVISIIEQIRSVRSELRVPAGSKVPLIQIKLDEEFHEVIERNKILIERLARLSSISETDQQLDGIVTITVDGGEFALHIADLIDIPAERASLLKTISKNNDEVNMLKNKLSNEKFLKNAPPIVINEAKVRVEDLDQDLIKLSSAINRLQGGGSS